MNCFGFNMYSAYTKKTIFKRSQIRRNNRDRLAAAASGYEGL